ncbi:hypothetical protein BH10PSE3_BH10PSE3_21410 [soil metagenome]
MLRLFRGLLAALPATLAALLATGAIAASQTPAVYSYQGSFKGEAQRTWELQRRYGDNPGAPLSMTLTINGDVVSGTVTQSGFTEKLSGYKRDGQCVLTTASGASVIGFCGTKFNGKFKVFDRAVRYSDRERDFSLSVANVRQFAPANPDAWLGRSPLDVIDGANLFNIEQVEFEQAFSYVYGASARRQQTLLWGKVSKIQASAKDGGGALYVFPFCFSGDCTDPNIAATGVGVLMQSRSYDSTLAASLYLASAIPSGTRYCYIQYGKWMVPTCYGEAVKRPFSSANLLAAARDVPARYGVIGKAYEASHPAQPGSLKYMAEHSKCDYVLVETRDGYGVVGYSSRLICQYAP